MPDKVTSQYVSIHSRLKAADMFASQAVYGFGVSIHSRLKAAGIAGVRSSLFWQFQYTAA